MTDPAIANLSPTERYEQMPRPLRYVRPRLYPAGAKWLKGVLEEIEDDDLTLLGEYRRQGLPEDHRDVVELRQSLEHAAQIIRDLSLGLIDLVGPQKEGD